MLRVHTLLLEEMVSPQNRAVGEQGGRGCSRRCVFGLRRPGAEVWALSAGGGRECWRAGGVAAAVVKVARPPYRGRGPSSLFARVPWDRQVLSARLRLSGGRRGARQAGGPALGGKHALGQTPAAFGRGPGSGVTSAPMLEWPSPPSHQAFCLCTLPGHFAFTSPWQPGAPCQRLKGVQFAGGETMGLPGLFPRDLCA